MFALKCVSNCINESKKDCRQSYICKCGLARDKMEMRGLKLKLSFKTIYVSYYYLHRCKLYLQQKHDGH